MMISKRYRSNVKVITSFLLLATKVIGEKTPRADFCCHVGAGDPCTLKSVRPFLMRVKTVREDWFVQNTIRILWKINLWTSAWSSRTPGVKQLYDNTGFYCLLKKPSSYRIFCFDRAFVVCFVLGFFLLMMNANNVFYFFSETWSVKKN